MDRANVTLGALAFGAAFVLALVAVPGGPSFLSVAPDAFEGKSLIARVENEGSAAISVALTVTRDGATVQRQTFDVAARTWFDVGFNVAPGEYDVAIVARTGGSSASVDHLVEVGHCGAAPSAVIFDVSGTSRGVTLGGAREKCGRP